MPAMPWKVAAHAVTVLDPETKEPCLTLQFDVDHQQSDVSRLRITSADPAKPAIELEFAAGGHQLGSAVFQPRFLKAFERPDVTRPQVRNAVLERRERWANDHDVETKDDVVNGQVLKADERPEHEDREPTEAEKRAAEEKAQRRGPDGLRDGDERQAPQVDEEGRPANAGPADAANPEAAKTREAGVENRSPSAEDRKGMVGIDPMSGAGVEQPAAGNAYNPSPGIQPAPAGSPGAPAGAVQPNTKPGTPQSGGPSRGKVVDSGSLKEPA